MALATSFGRTISAVARLRQRRVLGRGMGSIGLLLRVVAVLAFAQLAIVSASGQIQLAVPPENPGPEFKPKQIATFTGPADFQHELPSGVEITLDIVAGKAFPLRKRPGLESPVAAVTDPQGRLLVADGREKAIIVFDFVHRKYSEIPLAKIGLETIGGLAVDDKGDFYVTDTHQGKVFHFNANGSFEGYLQPSKDVEAYYVAPMGVAIDHARGFIYVCDSGRSMVVKLNRSGEVLGVFGVRGGGSGPGEFRRPTQIAVMDGDVYVLDPGNKRIEKIDANGNHLAEIEVPEGTGLAVDRWQRVLLSQPSLHRIAVLGQDGRLIAAFRNDEGGRRFDPSHLWLKSEHCLYVTDKANKSVELFSVGGASESSCTE